ALGEAREIAEDLDAAAAAGDRDAAQTFDGIVVELVVVEENGGLIGEEAEVGFEAVGAGAQRLFKRLQRVLRKTARTAAMAEDEKAIRRDRHLLFARDCRVSLLAIQECKKWRRKSCSRTTVSRSRKSSN